MNDLHTDISQRKNRHTDMKTHYEPAYLKIGLAVGDRVKQARNALQLTQKELAKRLSLSQSYLSEVENGKGKANVDLLIGLAVYFPELNPGWLLTGRGEMMAPDDIASSLSDFLLDFDALFTSEKLLNEELMKPGCTLDTASASYFVRLMYKTYMTHLHSLLSQGIPEDQARMLARTECVQLDRREIDTGMKAVPR